MGKLSKRQKASKGLLESEKRYGLGEALALLKKTAAPKFDESVDMAIRLGVDPRKADQMIRGSCQLPHGTGKSVRVLVVAKGEKLAEAEEAGADHYGGEELIEKIKGGWLEFDRMVATPDMMAQVGKVGKILGPRGLMPNPKVGTVTNDIKQVVSTIKAGQVEFRVDKTGILHVPVGRMSFDSKKLEENVMTLVETVKRMRPGSAKGTYMKSLTINSTMGPGVPLDPASFIS
ncbi:MAG: 50S ribosomal protein L1 [SAR324 cluster bacterium]|nr:50S ribosomal protein L1 [SAR324 cluster bacterium]MCZ6532378.1 50S ribosomal protein L1 [SAR324 cluster bacterium]MCZ6558430.1 50S ribosomal protein L1 [SAR324 cluster bacterium]MCZ6628668.1 50S ribosomal protein L1 [SAR324 cluster bacterium]MCZ6645966.1 50S ribosomal protein L1 [SAR324 cluster bacterium]